MNNFLIPTSGIRIVEEAHFRNFDLLIAAVKEVPDMEDCYANYNNICVRTQLLEEYAHLQKTRIDCIRFYPIELKSDDDILDERLPRQILHAILTFGLSIIVLDRKHSVLARALGKFLPATIICYTGSSDSFEVISSFDHLVSTGVLNLQKTTLARTLGGSSGGKAFSRLAAIERIFQKMVFNQIYFENLGMDKQELEFLQMIAGLRLPSESRKKLSKLIKDSNNSKMTDFI
jgi:hypothetical protein